MLIFKQNFLKLKSELKVDQCFNLFVVIVIGCIFCAVIFSITSAY